MMDYAPWVGLYPWDEYLDGQWHEYKQGDHWPCGRSTRFAIRVGKQMAAERGGHLETEHIDTERFRARFVPGDPVES